MECQGKLILRDGKKQKKTGILHKSNVVLGAGFSLHTSSCYIVHCIVGHCMRQQNIQFVFCSLSAFQCVSLLCRHDTVKPSSGMVLGHDLINQTSLAVGQVNVFFHCKSRSLYVAPSVIQYLKEMVQVI